MFTEQGNTMNQNPSVAGLFTTLFVSHPLDGNVHCNVSRAKNTDGFILATILRFLKEQIPS